MAPLLLRRRRLHRPGSHTTASIAGPSQLELPPFRPPADATVADMLGWRWRVWLGEGRRELARWEGRLSSVGRINPEAELELARG